MTPTDYFDYDCATTIKEATPEDLDAADLEMMQQLIHHASHTMALRIEFLERELHRATQAIATLMADGERQTFHYRILNDFAIWIHTAAENGAPEIHEPQLLARRARRALDAGVEQ